MSPRPAPAGAKVRAVAAELVARVLTERRSADELLPRAEGIAPHDRALLAVTKQNEALKDLQERAEKNEQDIVGLTSSKADLSALNDGKKDLKTGVASTNWRITRVEKKIQDTRVVSSVKEPMPIEEKTFAPAVSQPTHNVRYKPTPVYIDVYKYKRSGR